MKKGYTLLELILSLALASILMMILTKIFFFEGKAYKAFIIQDRNEIYCNEALRFIETQVEDITNREVIIEENKITIIKNNGYRNVIEKKIRSNNENRIIIRYGKNGSSITTSNTIMENIEDFYVYENKNLIYVKIKIENGVNFERCIEVQKIKKDL